MSNRPTGRKVGRPRGSKTRHRSTPETETPPGALDEELETEDVDEVDELEFDDPEEATSIERILAEYGEDTAFVNVSRYEGGAWTFLDKLSMVEASPVEIKAKYGGGRFRMKLLDAKMRYRKSITFRIAGKPKQPDEDIPGAIDPTLTGIDRVLARLDSLEKKGGEGSMTNEILKLVVAAALRPPPAPVTPQRDPLIETMITALIGGRQNSSGMDQTEFMQLVFEAERRGEERGRTLGEALATAAGEGDGVARVLAASLPQVIDAFGQAKQSYDRARPAPQARPAAARVANEPAAPSATTPQVEGAAPVVNGAGWIQALRPAVPIILKWARDNKDPQVKAANTVDDLSDDVRETIAIQAEEPTFVSTVIAAIPEFQSPPGILNWITIFLSTVQEILTSPADEEPPTGASTAEA